MVVAIELVMLLREQTQTTVQWDRVVMMVVQEWMLARRRGYQLMQQRIVPSGVITVIGICIHRVVNIIIIMIMIMVVRSCRSRVVMVGMVVVVVVVVKAIEVVM